jgi:hypothetical protein
LIGSWRVVETGCKGAGFRLFEAGKLFRSGKRDQAAAVK